MMMMIMVLIMMIMVLIMMIMLVMMMMMMTCSEIAVGVEVKATVLLVPLTEEQVELLWKVFLRGFFGFVSTCCCFLNLNVDLIWLEMWKDWIGFVWRIRFPRNWSRLSDCIGYFIGLMFYNLISLEIWKLFVLIWYKVDCLGLVLMCDDMLWVLVA